MGTLASAPVHPIHAVTSSDLGLRYQAVFYYQSIGLLPYQTVGM